MDFVDVFASNQNAIDLQDLVSLVQEAAALRCPALHHAAYYHAVYVVTHCRTLLAEAGVRQDKERHATRT